MKKILITLIGFVSLTILFGNTLQAKADSLASIPTVEAKITSAEGVVGEGSTQTKVIEHKELAYLSKFSTVPALEEKKYETTIEVEYYFTLRNLVVLVFLHYLLIPVQLIMVLRNRV
ncbi:MAG: hypothetical protein ACLR2Q_00135 [Finegoldia magna]